MSESERFWESVLIHRGVTEPCEKCGGMGVRAYPNTSTWHGGVGGQMITDDVCDGCWGSGDANRPWPDWRELKALRQLADDLIAYYDVQHPYRELRDIIADLKAVRK